MEARQEMCLGIDQKEPSVEPGIPAHSGQELGNHKVKFVYQKDSAGGGWELAELGDQNKAGEVHCHPRDPGMRDAASPGLQL